MKRIQTFIIGISVIASMASCGNTPEKNNTPAEDLEAKQTMQGIWVDELEGNCVFQAKGDTIFYTDSLSEPVKFHICADTLYLESSHPTKYHLNKLSDHVLRFVNNDGDEISLVKSDDKNLVKLFEKIQISKSIDHTNQGELIKRDSIIAAGDKRLHAYVQVNPTTYKVYQPTVNDDGVSVDHAYFDNIVHVALYDGARKIINRDYRKKDFAAYVPKEYIDHCILSDIVIENATADEVTFVAILSTPDTYTSYHINIVVNNTDGTIKMSV